jgi:hypothetical protein
MIDIVGHDVRMGLWLDELREYFMLVHLLFRETLLFIDEVGVVVRILSNMWSIHRGCDVGEHFSTLVARDLEGMDFLVVLLEQLRVPLLEQCELDMRERTNVLRADHIRQRFVGRLVGVFFFQQIVELLQGHQLVERECAH